LQAKNFFEPLQDFVAFLARWKLIPGHFKTLMDRLTLGGDSLVEADKKGLFTTSWQIIAQKSKSVK
jgi:sterol 24-C-methyltransferase